MNENIVSLRLAEPLEFPAPNDTLIAEAHHRVGNSLALLASIVRLQARSFINGSAAVPVADVRLMIEELGQRLDAVGKLHARLSRADGPVDLGDYLREIATSAAEGLAIAGRNHLHFDVSGACVVPAPAAPLMGLAVTELVMNAVKFAHPAGVVGALLIACNRRDDLVVVEVTDDGVGLPEGFDPTTDGQFGLQLLRSLPAQLKARLEFDDTGLGLRVRLSLPVDVKR